MNPEDLLNELDPMPGDEMMEEAPAEEPEALEMPQAEEPGMSDEERAQLIESMVLQHPQLRETYMRGLAPQQSQQMMPQDEEGPQYPELIQGDPGLEMLYSKFSAMEQELQAEKAARADAEARAADAQAVSALVSKSGAPPEIAQRLGKVQGLGLAISQNPEFAALMEELVAAKVGKVAAAALSAKSATPPAYASESSNMGTDPKLKVKAQNLKKQGGMFAGWTDAELMDYVKETEG